MRTKRTIGFLFALAMTLVGITAPREKAAAMSPITYTIKDLGDLGGSGSSGIALNNAGQVTGQAYCPGVCYHAFRWPDVDGISMKDLGDLDPPPGFVDGSWGTAINADGLVTGGSYLFDFSVHGFLSDGVHIADLGTLGGRSSNGNAISKSAITGDVLVTGWSQTATGTAQAFLYRGNGPMIGVGELPGLPNSEGWAINSAGQVTGVAFEGLPSGARGRFVGFIWDSTNGMTELSRLNGEACCASAFAINSAGYTTGSSSALPGGSESHAVIWRSDGTIEADLPPLSGGRVSRGNAINDLRQVTGGSTTNGFGPPHAFRYSNGIVEDLGTLGAVDEFCEGLAINAGGVVTGYCYTTGDTQSHAFVSFDGGTMIDLNELIPPGSGWVLETGNAINDSGQIAGTGWINGERHAFLLTPPISILPSISIADASIVEGNTGNATAHFQLTLSHPSDITVTVQCGTANGSATAGVDYVPGCGSATFPPGSTTASVSVTVVGDVLFEANEMFLVNLSIPANATIADAQAIGTIVNDDILDNQAMADLAISKTQLPVAASVGVNLVYDISVINLGPGPAPSVRVIDALPTSFTFSSVAMVPSSVQNPNPCTAPSLGATGTVTCDLGPLNAGSTATVRLVVQPTAQGRLTNTAQVVGVNDPNPGNNSSTQQTDVALTSAPFDQWIVSHCPPHVPGAPPVPTRVLNVAYIPAKYADTSTAPLSMAGIRARVNYIRDYFYQQSMCSVLVEPFVVDDPSSLDGWLTLPRTLAQYHPGNGGWLAEAARVWIDAFKVASLRRPDFQIRQQTKFFDAVFVIEPEKHQRSIALTTREIVRDPIIRAKAAGIVGVLAITAAPVLATLGPLFLMLAGAAPVLPFLLPPEVLVDAVVTPQLFEQASIVTSPPEPTGVWAHELGHGLFSFWDHYGEDTAPFSRGDITAKSSDLESEWGLMGFARSVPPPPIESYHRQLAGWVSYKTICNSCFGNYPLVPLEDMRFGTAEALGYDNRDALGFPKGLATFYIIERRNPPDDVPVAPDQTGLRVALPGNGQPGAMLYVKRDIIRFLGVPVIHPFCGPLHGFLQSLLDSVMGHDLGGCLEKVTNTQRIFGENEPKASTNYTLRPGDSYHDDLANITFTLNPNMTITISGTAYSRALVRMEASLQSSSASATVPLIPQPFPSVDLHVFASDGRHVGPNYVSGVYETGIAGARSGGVGTFDQWISFPDDVAASFVVDASQAVAAAQALGLTRLDIAGQVSVFRYDANGVRGKLQEPVPFALSLSVPRTAPAPIPLGHALGLIPPDTTAPVVTPPADITVPATEAGGAKVSNSAALATFLTSATGVDDTDPFVSRMLPQVNGVDVSTDTLFPPGTATVTFRSRDASGNIGTATANVMVVLDTPPSLVLPANIVAEATGAGGAAVTFTATATDAEDGSLTATCSPASGSLFPVGLTNVNCSVSDTAATQVTGSFSITVQDTTPPVITSGRSPVPNAAGWNKTDVIVTFACTDTVDTNPALSALSLTIRSELAGQSASATCTDASGNSATSAVSGINVDKTPPTISLTTPTDGAVYQLGQTVTVSYACSDTLSDVASCAGTFANGANLDTTSVGTKQFMVTSTDAAGNSTQRQVTYSVQYRFIGFFQPVDNLPINNEVHSGSTIPLKWQLKADSGTLISDSTSFASLTSAPLACDASVGDAIEQELTSAGDTAPWFDGTQWVFNWKTTKGWTGCRLLQLTLADGTQHFAKFRFR